MALTLWLMSVAQQPAIALPVAVTEALSRAGIPESSVSLFMQHSNATVPLITHRADQPRSPASTMKLVTTYAALEQLGPAYTWETRFLANGMLRNSVLDGPLYLQGSGDPGLTRERFWMLIQELRLAGVQAIQGELVIDGSRFAAQSTTPGAFDGQAYRPYNALPEATLVNLKTTRLHLQPVGDLIRIDTEPESPELQIINQLHPTDDHCGDWRSAITHEMSQAQGQLTLSLQGPYPRECSHQDWYWALHDNPTYVFNWFSQLWRASGGTLTGKFREGPPPPDARVLARQDSRPLGELVRDINKFSNNLMARQLLMTLGHGEAQAGAHAIQEWLTARGLAFPELRVENGSGLSREERISARHLGQLLLTAWRSPVMPELLASLPIAGMDGSLRQRWKNLSISGGRTRLKTGALDQVRGLAGYILDGQGQALILVWLVNDPQAAAGRDAQGALLQWIAEQE